MIHVSKPMTDLPKEYKTPLQKMTYKFLDENDIPFSRVENDEAVTMEDCIEIDKALDMKTVKTLFLCNRQKTNFYLFASAEKLDEIIGTRVGATTIFGVLRPEAEDVQVVFDKVVCEDEWYGCSDGTTTGYMKLKTKDILEKLLPCSKHRYTVIDV